MCEKSEQSNQKQKSNSTRSTIVTQIIIVFVSAFVASYLGSYFQGKQQIDLERYNLMTEFHCRTAELFNEAAFCAGKLIEEYGLEKVNSGNIPQEQMTELNDIIKNLNSQLLKMYVIMPDKKYRGIVDTLPVPTVGKLKMFRQKVLCELRKAQFSDTKYTEPNDMKLFELPKLPKKAVESKN